MRNRSLARAVLMVISVSLPTVGFGPGVSGAAAAAGPSAVIVWNDIAQRAAIQVAKQAQTQSMIYISFVQAAVYDAVVAIEGGHEPYAASIAAPDGASTDAAVAAAAHAVLRHYFPVQADALDRDYEAALAALPDDASRAGGVEVGRAAAAALIERRAGDGLEADTGVVRPERGPPGAWELPAGQQPQTPWVAQLRPFVLESPSQFRPGPPPDVASPAWTLAFNEAKRLGATDSVSRNDAKTDAARFWSTNAIVQYNTAFREVALERGLDALDAARLYAMGNLVGADALIACFDAKYHYSFWRPVFAVARAGEDGNPATMADSTWVPLLATPNHPEYPAAHGCLTSAEAEVFAAFFGTDEIDVDLASRAAGLAAPRRHYDSVAELTTEIVDARVWGGVHYRPSGTAGVTLGRDVATWVLARAFRPTP